MKFSFRKAVVFPHRVVREHLDQTNLELLSFFFRYSANIYVFSYEKHGEKRHTFIDTGYSGHHDPIFSILKKNGVHLDAIDQIIITHRHSDHCGLAALLAAESGAKILVHSNFKSFVEDKPSRQERIWLGNFEPSRLKDYNMVYLDPKSSEHSIDIEGIAFARVGQPIVVGDFGRLEIFACPESDSTHSPDQLIVFYSASNHSDTSEEENMESRPTDTILFSGDLWLMRGPVFERNLKVLPKLLRFSFYRLIDRLVGNDVMKFEPRIQDVKAKEALKQGFCLIRVKPGHGDEFLGSRIIPNSLPANRDILVKLGFSMDEDPSVLQSEDLTPTIMNVQENAYTYFKNELRLWLKLGYGENEIIGLLVRIYQEQRGGGPQVEIDRKERRKRIKETLARLGNDNAAPHELRKLWNPTLFEDRN
ncbi:MBL fold metallo-hydrolase [bacterium]|nr:MBL fold metallo-hydrolase [bacterium]